MSAILSVTSSHLAYGDSNSNNNPRLRFFDWYRQAQGVEVNNARSDAYTIQSGDSLTLFNGTRTLTIDASTSLSVALSTLDPSRYRMTYVGGADPTFRTDRMLDLNGATITVTVQANNSVIMQVSAGTFTGLLVGDTVFIPHTTTGDAANVFNTLNAGYWKVVSVSTNQIQLTRLPGTIFEGASEIVTLTGNDQFYGYSSAGVQVGDKIEFDAGFSWAKGQTLSVVAVTSKWVEFVSTSVIPSETASPGATGLKVFSSSKVFVRVESDQLCVVQPNGSTETTLKISPITAGDQAGIGWFEIFGPVFSLVVQNISTDDAHVTVLTCE